MIPNLAPRLGLDLGSGKTALVAGKKIAYCQPTLMVADSKTHRVIYSGEEAAKRLGKLSQGLEVVRPVVRGAIADYAATRYHLRKVFSIAMKPPRVLRPMVVAAAPITLNSVEERALCEAAREAGAGQIYLVPANLASHVAISSKINDPRGSLVIDIGSATTDIAVLASNEIIVGQTLSLGGDDLTIRVQRVLEMTFGVETGWEEALKAKKEAGIEVRDPGSMFIKRKYEGGGKSFKQVKVPFSALAEFIRQGLDPIINGIVEVLEETPPELYEDIFYRGLFLTGGTARLKGLDKYLKSRLDMKVNIVEEPELSVIRGIGKILGDFNRFREFFRHHATF